MKKAVVLLMVAAMTVGTVTTAYATEQNADDSISVMAEDAADAAAPAEDEDDHEEISVVQDESVILKEDVQNNEVENISETERNSEDATESDAEDTAQQESSGTDEEEERTISVTLPESVSLIEKNVQLEPVFTPENAQNEEVIWNSSNELIATVSQEGLVTAVSNGEADISVTTEDGDLLAVCKILVTAYNGTNGVCKSADTNWYYYTNGVIQTDHTGIDKNQYGWWRIENGKVNFNCNSIEKNQNGWWYLKDGKVDFSYNGFGSNRNGDWYVEGGKVKFNKNDVIKDANGVLGDKGAWYYVVKSKVTYTDTIAKNKNGWWRIENGKVNFNCNSVEKNQNGWWYLKNGKVDFNYTGIAKNKNGWWRIVKGKVDFGCNSVEKNQYGWWYLKGGKVDFGFTGIGHNSNGYWYCKSGKVDFSYTGILTYDGKKYVVVKGNATQPSSMPSSGWIVKNGHYYHFNSSGVMDRDTTTAPTLVSLSGYYISPMYAGQYNSTSERIEAMIRRAYDYKSAGTTYRICKSMAPGQYADCSGLVMQCLYAAGFDPYPATPAHHALPENEYDSRTLFNSVPMKHVPVSQMRRGDLIYYKSLRSGAIIHVAIYLGNGRVIESWPPAVTDRYGVTSYPHTVIYGVTRPFE